MSVETDSPQKKLWQASDEYVEMTAQELSAPERDGFTVIEWGGTEVK